MGWSLRQAPAQTGCSARAAGGPTQGWAGLWWCLRTTLSIQQTELALGEPVHTELGQDNQHDLRRVDSGADMRLCSCESFSFMPQ